LPDGAPDRPSTRRPDRSPRRHRLSPITSAFRLVHARIEDELAAALRILRAAEHGPAGDDLGEVCDDRPGCRRVRTPSVCSSRISARRDSH
jgi:hypothetical protein